MSGKTSDCCDYVGDEGDAFYDPDEHKCVLGYITAEVYSLKQELRGFDKVISRSKLSKGCKGLEEVFWILPTKLMTIKEESAVVLA